MIHRSVRTAIVCALSLGIAAAVLPATGCANQAGKVLAGTVRESVQASMRPHAERGLQGRIDAGEMTPADADVYRLEWDEVDFQLGRLAGQESPRPPPAPTAPASPASQLAPQPTPPSG